MYGDIPNTRFKVVILAVGRSDGSGDGRPDCSVALGRMSHIGSNEHGFGSDSGLCCDQAVSDQLWSEPDKASLHLRVRGAGSRR